MKITNSICRKEKEAWDHQNKTYENPKTTEINK